MRWLFLIALFLLALVSTLYSIICGNESFHGFLLNFGTELFGAVITYLLFDYILTRKENQSAYQIELFNHLHSVEDNEKENAIKSLIQSNKIGRSNIHNIAMKGISLKGLKISNAKISHSDFFGSNMSKTKIIESTFNDCNFWGANFDNCYTYKSSFNYTDFANSFIRNSKIYSSSFTDSLFVNCNLNATVFHKCDFNKAVFESTECKETVFSDCENISEDLKKYLIKQGAKIK